MKRYSTLSRLLLVAICSALPLAGANAGSVNFNGVLDAGDDYDGSFTKTWSNAHTNQPNIYGDTYTHTVLYTQDGDDLYLYLDMPLYAKNMVWDETDSDGYVNGYVSAADQASYGNQYSHHTEALELDYEKATGSEKIEIGVITADIGDGQSSSVSGYSFEEKSSEDWLFAAVNGYDCDDEKCNGDDIPFSFEFKFALSGDNAEDFIDALIAAGPTAMHLSPERGLLPSSPVPIPAAAWLFGSVLLGFGAFRRKKA
jgi:hypothetical protein